MTPNCTGKRGVGIAVSVAVGLGRVFMQGGHSGTGVQWLPRPYSDDAWPAKIKPMPECLRARGGRGTYTAFTDLLSDPVVDAHHVGAARAAVCACVSAVGRAELYVWSASRGLLTHGCEMKTLVCIDRWAERLLQLLPCHIDRMSE